MAAKTKKKAKTTTAANSQSRVSLSPSRGSILGNTFDPESLQVDIVACTGAIQRNWHPDIGYYWEELIITEDSVDVSLLNKRASLLAAHGNSYGITDLESLLGTVVEDSAFVENGEVLLRGQLSARDDLDGVRSDIADGTLHFVSIGYHIDAMMAMPDELNGLPHYQVTRFRPYEVSFCTVPVDFDSGTRTLSQSQIDSVRVALGANMKPKNKPGPGGQNTPGADPAIDPVADAANTRSADPAPDPEPAAPVAVADPVVDNTRSASPAPVPAPAALTVDQALALEDQRRTAIDSLITRHDLSGDSALCAQLRSRDQTPSVEVANGLILERMAQRDAADPQTRSAGSGIHVGSDSIDKVRDGIQSVLAYRRGTPNHQVGPQGIVRDTEAPSLGEHGGEFEHASAIQMAETVLRSRGLIPAGRSISPARIAEMAFGVNMVGVRGYAGVDDYPEILANTMGREMQDGYQEHEGNWKPLSRLRTAKDYKEMTSLSRSLPASLSEHLETDEPKHSPITEEAEKFSMKDYSGAFELSHRVILNDDLDAFMDLARDHGGAAERTEQIVFWGHFSGNPVMADGNQLYSVAHDNILGGAVSEAAFNAAAVAMSLRTDPGGALLNLKPGFIVTPSITADAANKVINGVITPDQVSNVNNQFRRWDLISTPYLDAVSQVQWYATAKRGSVAQFRHAYLSGQAAPRIQVTRKEGFGGMKIMVMHSFAVMVENHRGLWRSTGS